MIDIYVSIVSDMNHKLIIHINELEHMRNFMLKIKENLELKYEHLRGLNGLTAKEVKRITGLDFNRGPASVSRALKNPMSSVTPHGRVSDTLKANDHLMCDVESHDIWIKLRLMIEADQTLMESELEVKFDKSINGETFQKVIQRLILQIWNQYCQDKIDNANQQQMTQMSTKNQMNSSILSTALEQKNYVLTDFKIVSIDVGTALQIMDLDKSVRREEDKTRSRRNKKILYHMPDEKTVGEIFNYQNNQVKVACHFMALKDLFMQQVIQGQVSIGLSGNNNDYGSRTNFSQSAAFQSPKNAERYYLTQDHKLSKRAQPSPDSKFYNSAQLQSNKTFLDNKSDHSNNRRQVSPQEILDNDIQPQPDCAQQPFSMENNYHVIETDASEVNLQDQLATDNKLDHSYDILEENQSQVTVSKYNQVKIPLMIPNRKNSYMTPIVHRISFSKPDTQRENFTPNQVDFSKQMMTVEQQDAHNSPKGGNYTSQTLTTQMLYAVIQGNIVLPKKNPIIVEATAEAFNNDLNNRSNNNEDNTIVFVEEDEEGSIEYLSKSHKGINAQTGKMNPRISSSVQNKGKWNLTKIEEDVDQENDNHDSLNLKLHPTGRFQGYQIDENQQDNQNERLTVMVRKQTDQSKFAVMANQHPGDPDGIKLAMRSTVINESMIMDMEDLEEQYEGKVNLQTVVTTTEGTNYSFKVGIRDQPSMSAGHQQRKVMPQPKSPKAGSNKRLLNNDDLTSPLIKDINDLEDPGQASLVARRRTTAMEKIPSEAQNNIKMKKQDNKHASGRVVNKTRLNSMLHISSHPTDDKSKKNLLPGSGSVTSNPETQQQQPAKKKLFGNFFSKFIRTNAASKTQQKQTPVDLGLENLTEFELLQRIQLPPFLLSHEEYQLIQVPPVKNFTITEKDKGSSQAMRDTFNDNEFDVQGIHGNGADDAQIRSGVSKKNFVIVSIIVFLAAIFAVGIYFAVDLSSSEQ